MDPNARLAPAGQLVYEDFEPQYQWTSGKDTDTVTIDLTRFKDEAEFKKEHLKVKIDNHGNLKVSGERALGDGNRWRRFQKVFRMADDCITTDIKAKFDNGVLSIAMPKLTKDQPASTQQAPQPQPQPQLPPEAAAPVVLPEKPEPRAESRNAQVVEPAKDEKKETASDEEGEPAAVKPSPPAANVGLPTYGAGPRRRLRRVTVVVVVVAAMIAAAVGLGFYYWSHWNGIGPDEELDMTDVCLSEY